MRITVGTMLWIAITGCAGPEADGGATGDVEANTLGVTGVAIEHGAENGDPLLVARGFDAAGNELAVLRLRTGMVLYSPEPDIMAPGWNLGTDLSVTINGRETRMVTPDVEPHQILRPGDKAAGAFLRLNMVATALRAEAGLTPPTAEVPFDVMSCDASLHPIGVTYNTCCFDGQMTEGVRTNPKIVTLRYYTPYNQACRTSSGSSNCSGSACTYGPCGFTASSNSDYSAYGYIDLVDTYPTCTYNIVSDYPAYVFGGTSGTCPYTTCTNGVAS